jgi:hypothetical protein
MRDTTPHDGRLSGPNSLAAALLVILLAGCARPPLLAPTPPQMSAIAQQIQAALDQRPDLTSAKVIYQNNLDTPGSAQVDARVAPAADINALADDITRIVWQSKLDPLDSIGIDLGDPVNPRNSVSRVIDVGRQTAELIAKYGPRPTR